MVNRKWSQGSRRAFLRAAGIGSASCIIGGSSLVSARDEAQKESERYRRGFKILRDVGGADFDAAINAVAEVSPDLARFVVEYGYGDVLARPNLDLVTREALTVASLIAQGNHPLPTRYHIDGFLNVGGKPEVLVELCFLAIGICGFPAAIDTTAVIRDVLQERGQQMQPVPLGKGDGTERHLRGLRHLAAHGENAPQRLRQLAETSPVFAKLLVEFLHGELLTRDGLDAKTKYLSAISMLATAGNSRQSLRDYVLSALRRGVARDEIIEAIIQLTVYAGFPAALVGFFTIAELFREIDAKAVLLSESDETPDSEPSEAHASRFKRGADTLSVISGGTGQAIVAGFENIAPEIGQMIVTHSYGDIFSRPGIDKKVRELTAIASMASVGTMTSETPLRVHVEAALNVGATPVEVIETLLNLIPYVGYPKVERALALAGNILQEKASN
ncbi:carboxymuconolactone decarboxylase family protein [Denitrobaculum tricleocarpae]|nr:carboxymuconolactone decarboxylase family protein [Denitrobaculum tricleocarpae]